MSNAVDDDNDFNDDQSKPYEVGYGKPPKAHQFKKGISGHSRGRTPKSMSIPAMLQRELAVVITIKENGKPIRVSQQLAAVKRIVNLAINGSPRHLDYLIKFCTDHGVGDVFEVSEKDREAVRRALKRGNPPPKKDDEDDGGAAPAAPNRKPSPSTGGSAATPEDGGRPWTLPTS